MNQVTQSFADEATVEPSKPTLPPAVARVAELDGIRGIAILLVFGMHFGTPACPPGIVHNVLGFGWVGVELFFVLSGFLITGILLDSKDKTDYFRRFYLRRVFRILPIYYAIVIFAFHILPLIARVTGGMETSAYGHGEEAWYWVYLFNWRDATHQNGHLRHLWSLAIEEQFYIAWPLVVYLTRPRVLKYVCAGVAIASAVLRFAAGYAGINEYFLYLGTPFRLDGLALGALLALAARDPILQKRVGRVMRWAWPAAMLVIAAVVARSGPGLLAPAMAKYGYASIAAVCWAIVAYGVGQAGTNGRFAKFLRNPWLVRFGKYSYGLYVWHFLFVNIVHRYVGSSWLRLPLALVIGVTVSYGAALLSWKLIEEPCARLKERVAG
jgi:peptidoglycan/LPS O-acetylase OafA/YrhL